jgi:hypothetical protein
MKKYLLVALLFFSSICIFADNIGINKAEKVAINWINERAGYSYSKNNVASYKFMIQEKDTLFYVIEFSPKGYAVISADDIAVPVIMYNPDGTYSGDLPPAAEEIFKSRKEELLFAKRSGIKSSIEIKKLWDDYSCETSSFQKTAIQVKVDPLITVTWDQSYPYNKFCPSCDSEGSGGKTYAGCVALAYAQIIKYHNWPSHGKGSYEYVYQPYGKISADFENTYYDWTNMSNTISSNSPAININAVATLIFHCGVGVNMLYGSGGSGAETPEIRNALVKYFRYSDEAVVISKKNKANSIPYTDIDWSNVLKNELLNKRPFVYRGNNISGNTGHAFLIHGFTGDYFNVNFGWSGSYNGLYYLSAITPATYNFSYDNSAIINIKPDRVVKVLSPADKATNQSRSVTLQWNYTGKSINPNFRVQLSLNKDMKVIAREYNTTSTSLKLTDLMAGNRYYWRLSANSGEGSIDTTDVYTFLVKFPESTQLYQNYPNPFNPSTTIRFDVTMKGYTKVKIFSVTGEVIATLVDGFLEAKEYRVSWDAKNVASGVYFCHLETPDFSGAKKLILIK